MINIIIPAYNCCATLGKTLASLVAQTDTDFEVIVVDDYSTEDIKSIVDDYANKLKIIYIRNEQNIGAGMSRQIGIDNSTQKFITFLDSDDMFMPYTVETFNAVIEANPNTEYLHTYFYEQVVIDDSPALFLCKDNYTAHHGKLYNVEMLKKYNICNVPNLRFAEDAYFNSICSELMQMSIIRIPTMLWVNNKNSMIRKLDPDRDATMKRDFLNAMLLSAEFVLKQKESVNHLSHTIEKMTKQFSLNEEETEQLNKLLNYIRR